MLSFVFLLVDVGFIYGGCLGRLIVFYSQMTETRNLLVVFEFLT